MKLWAATLLGWAALAAFAPLIANEVPLAARADGVLRFPALASYFGDPGLAPGGLRWKAWWEQLDDGSGDWAVMPPWPYGPREISTAEGLAGPSLAHPLGVDDLGRDQLARLLHGASTALLVALGSVALALAIGLPLGALGGLGGRLAEFALLRWIEILACFPSLLAVLAVAAFGGGSLAMIVIVLAVVYQAAIARIVRGELFSLRERGYVQAARAAGVGRLRLLALHLLPQLQGPLLVAAAFLAADAILVESTLTFLGLGGAQGTSWGAMLDQGRSNAHRGAWHLWLFPSAALASVVVALHASQRRSPPVPGSAGLLPEPASRSR